MSSRPVALVIIFFSYLFPMGLNPVDCCAEEGQPKTGRRLDWTALPDLPDPLGVAGPFVGIQDHDGDDKDMLFVIGGANFAKPVWENDKVWHQSVHIMQKKNGKYQWTKGDDFGFPVAYGAAVSLPEGRGVLCIGGNDSTNTFDKVTLVRWNEKSKKLESTNYPPLPKPCAFTQAALIGDKVYVAGGQAGGGLDSAMKNFWVLDLKKKVPDTAGVEVQAPWDELESWPGPSRAFNLTVAQHNGYENCIYVISGRRQEGEEIEFLNDVWEYTPSSKTWRTRRDAPQCVMAGIGIEYGQSHIFVLGGADGSLYHRTDELLDDHPGFPKKSFAYHTITNTWVELKETPQNHVTTIPVKWGKDIIVATGEVRPRVRTAKVWKISPVVAAREFGVINYLVLVGYLLAMVGVGVYFSFANKNTDDYFRGGMRIPWWAAGCSIFATMLSSLTFTGIPSKSYAQDWVYSIGNMMIPVVAFVAVYVALPFYRRIDATSAYEYLEKRFNRPVRYFGSISFTLFHVFRMAVVMSLTGLALAVATPLSPASSVLIMGLLSILYCTMGGVEAVIWTDTIQTFVLLGGAVIAIWLLVAGVDGGWSGFMEMSMDNDKFRLANFHGDITNAQIALWVIVIGAIGQNVSSYTADQAVVQRYMTTPNEKLAARSIWTNAVLSVPATILFFAIGTALFAFYRSHPEKIDPSITTDQIFPLFIANEMPVGLAGLIVAGIFAAAQSTVSTSMNSTATAIVTDFLRPFDVCGKDERGYLRYAQGITLTMGVIGTLLALVFVDPNIKSLFDEFLKIVGLFMGVLGGLFVLGVTTRRANGTGAMAGAIMGAVVMFCLWKFTKVNGYLYTVCGLTSCCVFGYAVSLLSRQTKDLTDLTLHTLTNKG
ncbi:MAG: SSS family solute:Na+ symporter [Pirellulaceae bacterium]|jgi:SSS family solute:Na+ symporter